MLYNATYLFTLIQNVDWVTFKFNHQEYKIDKQQLIEWYGEGFSKSQCEKDIQALIQKNWNDAEKINQLVFPPSKHSL